MSRDHRGAWSQARDPDDPSVGAARREHDRQRGRRKRPVRPHVLRTPRTTKRELRHLRVLDADLPGDLGRPRSRSQCASGPRPCPHVSCRYNLYLDVVNAGSIKLNFPDLEPDAMAHSCALDIADQGGVTMERVAELMNLTRERVRQIEERALHKLKTIMRLLRLQP